MKNNIVLVTLSGCSKCKKLIEILNTNQIKFIEVPCDKDPGMCDQLEKITGKSHYPMAVIKDLTKNLDYIYFTSFDYNELGKERIVDEKVRAVPFFSQEEILKKIKNI